MMYSCVVKKVNYSIRRLHVENMNACMHLFVRVVSLAVIEIQNFSVAEFDAASGNEKDPFITWKR